MLPGVAELGRVPIPEGGPGSIVTAPDVTIHVEGKTAQDLGYSYEQGIRDVFGSARSRGTYVGQIDREVDDLIEDGTILEGKHTEDYIVSIYNPELNLPFPNTSVQKLIAQARALAGVSPRAVIYFTNDEGFARDYAKIFQMNGIENFRFVIARSVR